MEMARRKIKNLERVISLIAIAISLVTYLFSDFSTPEKVFIILFTITSGMLIINLIIRFSQDVPEEQPIIITKPEPLPPGWIMPFPRNPNFVGRAKELKMLHEKLTSGDVSLGQTAAATGLGGIGKTQLAVEFVYQYGKEFDGGVFWLDMFDPENIPNEIAKCAGPKGMNLPEFDKIPQEKLVEMVLMEWAGEKRRLVVFDNVDEVAVAEKWRPNSGGTRVLITTRIDSANHLWKDLGIEAIPVGILPREKSLELLCRGCGDALKKPDERKAADEICDLLGDLPLAIHLAGSYLSRYRHDVSLREYLDDLRSQPVLQNPALVDNIRDPSPTEHLQNVAATFETSHERLDQKDETDALAARLFHLTSHFAPTSIPRELLIRSLENDRRKLVRALRFLARLLKIRKDRERDKTKVADALNRLCELGLVQSSDDDGGDVTVHRLLREFAYHHPARGQKPDDAAEDTAWAVFDFANEINKSGLPARLRENVEHLRYAIQKRERSESDLAGSLYNELGYHLQMVADFTGAEENFTRAIEILEKVHGEDHPDVASAVNNLGDVLRALGDLEGAREHFTRAIEIGEKVHGKDHPQVAIYVNNLGSVLRALGDLEGARENYTRALEIDERAYGKDHPDVAIAVNNLGGVLRALGDLEGAREHFTRAIEIGEKVYGKDHPSVAIRVNNLGFVLRDLGDLEGAREHCTYALDIFERLLGPDHPSTQTARRNLQGVLDKLSSDA